MNKLFYVIGSILLFIGADAQDAPNSPLSLFEYAAEQPALDKEAPVRQAHLLTLREEVLRDIHSRKGEPLRLELPLTETETVILEVAQAQVMSNDFTVSTSDDEPVEYMPGLHYQGHVAGKPGSLAGISFFQEAVMSVFTVEGETYVLGLRETADDHAEPSYILYKDNDWTAPREFQCAVEGAEDLETPPSPEGESAGRSSHCAKIYFECDYHMYDTQGNSVSNVVDYVTGLFNIVHIIYGNESIPIEIQEVYVWTSTDPYAGYTSSGDFLYEFENQNPTFNGNLAHLLSTRPLNAGGIAYLNGLCPDNVGYAFSNIPQNYQEYPNYSWTIMVVSHELGHNFGSPHTQSCSWTGGALDDCVATEGSCSPGPTPTNGGSIMSYCHQSSVGINFEVGFLTQPGDLIRNRFNTGSCMTSCSNNCLTCPAYDYDITPTTSWQTHSSSHSAGDCRVYRISVTEDNQYTFKTGCSDGATTDFSTHLTLMDDNCTAQLSDNNGCGSPTGASSIEWTADYTGYAYLRVKGNTADGGNYTLAHSYCEAPVQPDNISGQNSICEGDEVSYSIDPVSGANNYTWAVPSGWSINGGQGSENLSITADTTSGNLCVVANNSCGSSVAECVWVNAFTQPRTPDTIFGSTAVVSGKEKTYSVDPLQEAETYLWFLPSGWSGNSSTYSIDVTPNENSGFVCLRVQNGCGMSDDVTCVEVTAEKGTGIEDKEVASPVFSLYPNPTTGDFALLIDGTVEQQVAVKVTNTLGQAVYTSREAFTGDDYTQAIHLDTAPGMYFVTVTIDDRQREIRKVSKIR